MILGGIIGVVVGYFIGVWRGYTLGAHSAGMCLLEMIRNRKPQAKQEPAEADIR